ncbi:MULTISPECIES: ABC transporter permease [Roseateles]|uniref:ATP-binding cassette domain-containing protein n=1 Tax=Pelomonas caseinilytica TaxID=2906763 RepID=A0ABS8XI23_9BURK|nr:MULTISPECIES: ABC transporter permease [unclassified Roseateles]MCE4539212.1 ATP-binding cassette domain-containing protein [Pelomonas sp. P7]HEV6965636.1 ABC transporter permease [Roseateles sp.]
MPLIELQDVARHYQLGEIDVPALDGVSLAIEAGEFVAIMGQSGSGKSTLMNVLGCLDNPTHGHFLIDGRDASTLGPDQLAALRRERFGFIFQRYHLLPHLDARANAALPAVYAGVAAGARGERARALLERLGLGERLHHRPSELSGGQQQRVSIARALMNGGQIILADEPTGALDSASGAEMLGLLRELNDRGHTVILVTHDAAVAAHARRIIELRDGKVVADSGTPAGHRPPESLPSDAPPVRQGGALRRLQVQWREALATAVLALRGNRLRTALSMLGISIGIASVVSIVALTSAARSSIEGDLSSLISGRIPVWRGNPSLPPGAVPQPFRPHEIDALRALPGVKGVTLNRQMQLTARHQSRDAALEAVGGDANTLKARKLKLAQGRWFNAMDYESRAQVIVLDEKSRDALFKKNESPLGRRVFVNPMGAGGGPAEPAAVPGGLPAPPPTAALPFTVIGVALPEGGAFSFGSWMGQLYLPNTTFARKLDARTDVDNFDVLLDLTVPPQQVREQIIHRLKALHGAEDFGTWNGEEEFRKFQSVTGAMAAVFAGVGAIALLVGGVGVMNIMLVSVSERTREIGIRMAIGARQGDVRLQFLIEAVVLCCLGGLVGVMLSWLAAQVANAAQSFLHVDISWAALGVAFAVSSGVGLLFGTLPARRAAALSPVDALARE